AAHAVHRALFLRAPRLPPPPALAAPEHAPPLARRPPLPRARALLHRVRGPGHPRGVAPAAGHRRRARLADPLDAAGPAPRLRGLHPGDGGGGAGVALPPAVALAMNSAVHLAAALFLSPLMLGVITRVKARFAGRRGAPLLQPYLDLVKLFRKGSIFSRTTTWVFRMGPVVGLATAALASLLVPMGGRAPFSFEGDVLLFAYLLGLGRFFTVAAAMDTGSAFEGMGAAREVTYSALAEPALFLSLLVL